MTSFQNDLHKIISAAGDAMVVCDSAGLITLWNPAAERMFGHSKEQALGQSLDIIIPERQRARHWDGYHKTAASGITKYGHDLLKVPALHRDGHTLSIAFSISLLKGEGQDSDKVVGMLSIIRSIMIMPVVDVRVMWMRVRHRLVPVTMAVRPLSPSSMLVSPLEYGNRLPKCRLIR